MPEFIYNQLPVIIDKFEINTSARLAHFLSQTMHESNGFKSLTENLNYSEDGLLKIFGKYFTKETVKTYARKPEMIANKVYANRMGNGDEKSGDGWKHKGVGAIQLTGKSNHQAFFKYMGLDINTDPSLIATRYALVSAAWFWLTNKLNQLADKGTDMTAITNVTKRINGGTIGISDRIEKFNKIYTMLNKKEDTV